MGSLLSEVMYMLSLGIVINQKKKKKKMNLT